MGGGAGQGTELAVGAPAAATPATALGPGDRLAATGLSLARGLQHLGEAGPLPGVWKERVGMVGGRNELSGCPFPVASSGVESLHVGSQHLRRICARARGVHSCGCLVLLNALSGLGLGCGGSCRPQTGEVPLGCRGWLPEVRGQHPSGRRENKGQREGKRWWRPGETVGTERGVTSREVGRRPLGYSRRLAWGSGWEVGHR